MNPSEGAILLSFREASLTTSPDKVIPHSHEIPQFCYSNVRGGYNLQPRLWTSRLVALWPRRSRENLYYKRRARSRYQRPFLPMDKRFTYCMFPFMWRRRSHVLLLWPHRVWQPCQSSVPQSCHCRTRGHTCRLLDISTSVVFYQVALDGIEWYTSSVNWQRT